MEPLPLDFIGEEWSSEFTPADIQFIEECQDALKDRRFSTGELVVWAPKNKDWKPVQVVPRSDSTFYDELSWPVFNEKRDLAVVNFRIGYQWHVKWVRRDSALHQTPGPLEAMEGL